MQSLTNEDNADRKELQIKEKLPPRERMARKYIKESFTGKMPSLIPFSLESESIVKLASNLLKYTTGSRYTLYQYVFGVHRFSKWLKKKPDDMVVEIRQNTRNSDRYRIRVEEFIGDLQAEGLAHGTIANHVKGVRALFKANRIDISFPRLRRRVIYHDRSPNAKELTTLLDVGDLRDKVIISLFALGGFRVGTLVKLQYRHVKKDLEAGIVPIHVHVEAEITKGKYGSYDTFLGAEAVLYLKAYLEFRRKGNENIPPEKMEDSSPIIRDKRTRKVRSISTGAISRLVSRLYAKTNMRKVVGGKSIRYDLRVHSIRKYFRTQLGLSNTIKTEQVEYMMGHIISTYNDLSTNIENLRGAYSLAGISIRTKKKTDIYDFVEDILKTRGYDFDKELLRKAIAKPHRTICSPANLEEERRSAIRDGFMKMMRKEFLDENSQTNHRGAPKEDKSGILYSTEW
jgi:integrase